MRVAVKNSLLSSAVVALYRSIDPATSKEAAQEGEQSGAFGGQRLTILSVLQDKGDMHAGAIADECGLLTHQVLKRLSDLQRMGFAMPTDRRVGKQRVWTATSTGAKNEND